MRYAENEFYQAVWGGRLSDAELARLGPRAEARLEGLCGGRLAELWPGMDAAERRAVSMAACCVADALAEEEATGGRALAAETVGRHAVRYHTSQSGAVQLRAMVRPYLAGVAGGALLYRGVAP